MAEFQEVIKQMQRMCKHYDGNCKECRINIRNNGKNLMCNELVLHYPQEAEEIIMKWAEEQDIMDSGTGIGCQVVEICKADSVGGETMRNDTILCKNKEEAKDFIENIGMVHISDWEFFRDGSVKIFLNCKLEDIKEKKGCINH